MSLWIISAPVSERNDSAAWRSLLKVATMAWVFESSVAMARPMPRPAPVTSATGLLCGGKLGVDGFSNFFEGEALDEGLPVHQDRGRLRDSACYAILEIVFHQRGQALIVESGHRLGGIGPVVLCELPEPIVERIGLNLTQVGHGVLAEGQAQSGRNFLEIARGDGRFARPGVFSEREIAVLERHLGGVSRKKLLVHHAAEIGAIRTLQILVNNNPHGALRGALRQVLSGGEDAHGG